MSFNPNDLNDDDDFNFDNDFDLDDDSPAAGGDEFKFDDEPADIGLEDEAEAGGFGFEGEDMPELDDDGGNGGEQRGTNRTFIIVAALLVIMFILGLGVVLIIAISGNGQLTDIEKTATAISIQNATTVAQLAATQTAAPLIQQTQTQDAFLLFQAQTATASVPTATPIPPTDTATLPPTATAPLDATQVAGTAIAQQTVDAALLAQSLTETAFFIAAQNTPTPAAPSVSDVALTATALVALLQPEGTLGQGGGVPTQEVFGPTATRSNLPQTGFFDDIAAGNANMGIIALMALGLVGIIGVSRVIRANNK